MLKRRYCSSAPPITNNKLLRVSSNKKIQVNLSCSRGSSAIRKR
jgi:hypothetical protein